MIRYLAGRLLLAIPTLFGITLVTFGVMHLAPGTPVVGDRPMSPDAIERYRRQYCLDLPVFLNFDVRDRRHVVGDLIHGLADPPTRVSKHEELRRLNTLAVPYLWRAREMPGVSDVLAEICQNHQSICPGGDLAALHGASERPQASAVFGKAAVPLLMDRVKHGSEAERSRAMSELATIVGAQRNWEGWWLCREREYVEFDRRDRAVGLFTETQYGKWIRRIATWNLGTSIVGGQEPVAETIADRLPVTVSLAALALVLIYALGIPLGVWSATRRGSRADRAVAVLLFVLYSLPSFWVASVLILLLGRTFDVLPIYGICPLDAWDLVGLDRALACAPHFVMPVACLTYGSLAVVSRYQRTGVLEVLGQDYVRTARAKGLTERAVVRRHVLRNALIPVITLLGLHLPLLLGGSIIIEKAFTIRGMGLLAFDSIYKRDYPTVMGITLLSALITMASVLAADVLYAVVDPRISYERR